MGDDNCTTVELTKEEFKEMQALLWKSKMDHQEEREKADLHEILRDPYKDLRAAYSSLSSDVSESRFSRGLFYSLGPHLTSGLTRVQYDELVRLAKVGLAAERS